MTEERLVLALGGGAAKGLAHVGVLKALEEDGIEVDAVAGTSMGSIVGALFCRGMTGVEMEAFFSSVDWSRLGRILLRSPGGSAFRELMRETLGGTSIESLKTPFAAVCCDIDTGKEVVIREGPLADAVLASSAIPGILPPVMISGRTLVDGALVTPVPVTPAAVMARVPVLAVNVLKPPSPSKPSRTVIAKILHGAAPTHLAARMEAFFGDHPLPMGRREADYPNRFEVVMRSFHLMQYNLSLQSKRGQLLVEPEVGTVGWFEFERAPEIIAEGYRAYRAVADSTPESQ